MSERSNQAADAFSKGYITKDELAKISLEEGDISQQEYSSLSSPKTLMPVDPMSSSGLVQQKNPPDLKLSWSPPGTALLPSANENGVEALMPELVSLAAFGGLPAASTVGDIASKGIAGMGETLLGAGAKRIESEIPSVLGKMAAGQKSGGIQQNAITSFLPELFSSGKAEAASTFKPSKLAMPDLAAAFGNLFKGKVAEDAKKIVAFDRNAEMIKILQEQTPAYDAQISKLTSDKMTVLEAMRDFEGNPLDTRFADTAKHFQDQIDSLAAKKNEHLARVYDLKGLDEFAKNQRSWWQNSYPVKLFNSWTRNGKTSLEKISPSGVKLSNLITKMQEQEEYNKTIYGRVVKDVLGDIDGKKSAEEWGRFRALKEAGKLVTKEDKILNQKIEQLSNFFLKKGNEFGILLNDATGEAAGLPNYFTHQLNAEGKDILYKNPKEFYEAIIQRNQDKLSQLAEKIRMASPNSSKLVTLDDALRQLEQVKRNPSISTIERIAEAEGMDVGKLASIYDKYIRPNIVRKAGFEQSRDLALPDKWIENMPVKAYMEYAGDASKRFAMAEHFGADYSKLMSMRDKMLSEAQMTGHANNLDSLAKETNSFLDGILGRETIDRELHAANRIASERIYRAKLGLYASIPNAFQGVEVATGFFGGTRAAAAQAKALLLSLPENIIQRLPAGAQFIKDKRFIEEVGLSGMSHAKEDMEFAQKVWSKLTPFPITEDVNYRTLGLAARDWMNAAYKNMLGMKAESPAFQSYLERMRNLGVDPKEALKKGAEKLTDGELRTGAFNAIRKGLFPKLIGDYPEFFREEKNRASYIFFHFMLQQPKYWGNALKIGTPGTLASSLVLAAGLGEGIGDISYGLQGKKRTENPALRIAENIFFAQPLGWIGYNASQFGANLLPTIGGPMVGGIGNTISRTVAGAKKEGAWGAVKGAGESYLRGDIPGVPTIPFGSDLVRTYKAATRK